MHFAQEEKLLEQAGGVSLSLFPRLVADRRRRRRNAEDAAHASIPLPLLLLHFASCQPGPGKGGKQQLWRQLYLVLFTTAVRGADCPWEGKREEGEGAAEGGSAWAAPALDVCRTRPARVRAAAGRHRGPG